jgi:hypothetical protein
VEYLSKPYDRERLATMVRRVLEDPERTGAGHQAPSNILSRQINKACPAKNINTALTIDWILLSQLVFNARYRPRYRHHPHLSKVRVYRNANEIRARTGYPLTAVHDKPRSQSIRSAVTAADGM